MQNEKRFTIRQLLEVGAHFGHRTMRWNPKMAPYIFGVRNGLHIIDLNRTATDLSKALDAVQAVARRNGKILFVGTKNQASETIKETAEKCGQYYVNQRWVGGTLTNWSTVSGSIKTLENIEKYLNDDNSIFKKKEKIQMEKERHKLNEVLSGIRSMGRAPDMLIVFDTLKENLAVAEAKKLGIPIVAPIDTNCTPDDITYPFGGNDDSIKAVRLYCKLFCDAILEGIRENVETETKKIATREEKKNSTAAATTRRKANYKKSAKTVGTEHTNREDSAKEDSAKEEVPADEAPKMESTTD